MITLIVRQLRPVKASDVISPNIATAWESIPAEVRRGTKLYLDAKPDTAHYLPTTKHRGIYMGSSYEDLPFEETRGVLLHELGHAHEPWTSLARRRLNLAITEFNVYLAFYALLVLAIPTLPGGAYAQISVYALLLLNQVVFGPLFYWRMREAELRADLFAVKHGSGEGLYRNLSLSGTVKPGPNQLGFTGTMLSTHPTTPHRLAKMVEAGVAFRPRVDESLSDAIAS